MRRVAHSVLVAAVAAMATAVTVDVSFAQKKRAAIPQGACKIAKGYIASGEACTTAPNQYNMSQINWCSFGSFTPGIYCAGALCPATKC